MKAGDIYKTNGGCKIKVIENNGWDKVLVEFQDHHKHRLISSRWHVKEGSVKNPYRPSVCGVGYVGFGAYKTSKNSNGRKAHAVWWSMIQRCYDPKIQVKKPTYIGCTVHPDWHNFQNFAEWYTNHEFYGLGYHIDKDLLVKGNKVYSPDTCTLVPIQINQIITYRGKVEGLEKTGVYKRKDTGKFIASLTIMGQSVRVGEFSTEAEAYRAYAKEKCRYIAETCKEFEGLVSDDVICSLREISERIKNGDYYV